MSSQTPHEIVIVGGNFGGVDVAHYLLRNTLPALKKAQAEFTYHITLVTPNTHFFFKVASPRAIVNQTQAPHDKIFKSLAAAFEQYEPGVFTLVQGKATAVKESEKSVVVQTGDATRDVKYNSLIIASGTTSTSPIWTLHDDHKRSEAAITALHASLATATTVLIAGAGPVGIETAGEIAVAHPTTRITLLAPGTSLLPSLPSAMGTKAQKALEYLGVNIRPNTRLEKDANGVVKLSDGSTESPDVFIDATGPRIINTSWLPETWLDGKSHVATRDAYFRVSNAANVYVIGDVVSGSHKTAIELNAMTLTVASSVGVDIAESLKITAPQPGFLSALNPFATASPLSQKEYKPMKNTIIIPVGPGGGVGQVMGFAVPSFVVKKGKAENFLMELIEPSVSGEKWKGK
jgi:NADH dehydrogenase FAD-containing subunit